MSTEHCKMFNTQVSNKFHTAFDKVDCVQHHMQITVHIKIQSFLSPTTVYTTTHNYYYYYY